MEEQDRYWQDLTGCLVSSWCQWSLVYLDVLEAFSEWFLFLLNCCFDPCYIEYSSRGKQPLKGINDEFSSSIYVQTELKQKSSFGYHQRSSTEEFKRRISPPPPFPSAACVLVYFWNSWSVFLTQWWKDEWIFTRGWTIAETIASQKVVDHRPTHIVQYSYVKLHKATHVLVIEILFSNYSSHDPLADSWDSYTTCSSYRM